MHGGNRSNPRDPSPMLCQLSYEAKSVRVCVIYFGTKSSIPSIPMCSMIMIFLCVFFFMLYMYSGEYNVLVVTLSVYPHRAG
jgi:hypothetical protein